jgi:predicted MFS family arabinose efflux permease
MIQHRMTTFRESLSLLGTRRFGTFWFASLLSSIGTWAQQVAEPWLLLTLGASSFLIGLDSFAMNAPVWLLTLAGGALADRSDRRQVITVFQSIQMLCPTAIVILMLAGTIHPWTIILLSVVVGVTDALSMPSFQSIVPSIVTREQIGSGLALNSTQFNLSRILGPSLAGVLMSSIGTMACFVVSAVSYVPFIGVALWILPRRSSSSRTADGPTWMQSFAGIREILRQRHLRGALLTVLLTGVLCAPLLTFSPVLVKEVFKGGAGHFSAAVASFGIGGLIGAGALLSIPATIDRRRISGGFAVVHGFILVLTAMNQWFWVLPVLLAFSGVAMTISNTAANALIQTSASSRVLGLTVSLYMLAMRGGISIGALVTGAAVSLVGIQRTILFNGVVAILLQTAFARAWLRAPMPSIPLRTEK